MKFEFLENSFRPTRSRLYFYRMYLRQGLGQNQIDILNVLAETFVLKQSSAASGQVLLFIKEGQKFVEASNTKSLVCKLQLWAPKPLLDLRER